MAQSVFTDFLPLRRRLIGGMLATLILVGVGFARFPLLDGAPAQYLLYAMTVAGIVCLGTGAGWWLAPAGSAAGDRVLGRGGGLGLILGLVWMAYILGTHLLLADTDKPTTGGVLTIATFAVTLLGLLVGSGASAWQTGRGGTGLRVGLGAALIAGLLAFWTLLVMLYLFMGFLAQHMNPGELQALAQSGWQHREAWFFWNEELAGALGYFLTLALLGLLGGLLGGGAGQALATLTGKARRA